MTKGCGNDAVSQHLSLQIQDKQVYQRMSAKEKDALKWRMAEIDKAVAGNKEITPPSLTPMWIRSRNWFMLLVVSLLHVLIDLYGC